MKLLIAILLELGLSLTAFSQQELNNLPAETRPFVLGVIDELPSKILSEQRTLNIYLPEGYNPADSVRYPVVYLLDGSADEDFIHVVGLYQFSSFPWVARVPKSIIVGIANIDRKRDFTFPTSVIEDKKKYPTTGGSAKFIKFLENELQPYIEHRYKTNDHRTIIGESLGGLLATEILLKHPSLFDQYIIVSPSLWWNNGSLLKQDGAVLHDSLTQPVSVYIGVGKEGLTPSDPPRVMEVDANVLADKIRNSESKSVKVYFDYLPQEDHASIAHQALLNALRMLK
jgi:predicted alpha/beta superfamily hydrolase